jgi:hypothetical protein
MNSISHKYICIYICIFVFIGMEAFQDGMIIKEAFVILYACIVIVTVLSNLDVDQNRYLRICCV